MVMGMSMPVIARTPGRPADAAVVLRALDIAGSRHEVLPPRMIVAGADVLYRSTTRAPPP
jgi:hypothetical protein